MVAVNSLLQRWAITAAASGYWGAYQDCASNCDLSNVQISLPSAQLTTLGQPNSSHPVAVAVAFGVQNYTCSANNNFTSTGAVAQLYDISCLYQASPTLFQTIQQPLYEAWANVTSDVTVQQITAILPALLSPDVVLADHYFVPNPSGTGLSPIWDMRATKRFQGNQNAFMLGKSFGSVASPVDPSLNINWLRVAKVSGDAADEVFRIDTLGGQPPTSCTSGQTADISVRYTSQYWFFGGSLFK